MNFPGVEEFIRAHWPAAIIVTVLVAPVVWTIAVIHFSERISFLESKVADLNLRVTAIDELAKRSRETLVSSTANFSAAELYTPSDNANIQGK